MGQRAALRRDRAPAPHAGPPARARGLPRLEPVTWDLTLCDGAARTSVVVRFTRHVGLETATPNQGQGGDEDQQDTPLVMPTAQAENLQQLCQSFDDAAKVQEVKLLLGVAAEESRASQDESGAETWLNSVVVESARATELRASTHMWTCTRKTVVVQSM